jgi:hypothetical protein
MATQRYISTSFWDDEWVQTLDPSEKLLFLYYMTNPLTNIAGVYKITLKRISFDTGFTSDTIGHIMQKFIASKKVFRHGEYIVLPSWPRHQKIDESPKIRAGVSSILNDLHKDTIQFLITHGYAFDLSDIATKFSIPYQYPSNYSDLDPDLDLDSDTTYAAPSEPPKPKTPKVPEKTDPIYTRIWETFIGVTERFSDYAKEGKLCKGLCAKIRNLDPDNPEVAAKAILEAYHKLTKSSDTFWSSQPFTPSGLSPLLQRVWANIGKAQGSFDTSWVERSRKERGA